MESITRLVKGEININYPVNILHQLSCYRKRAEMSPEIQETGRRWLYSHILHTKWFVYAVLCTFWPGAPPRRWKWGGGGDGDQAAAKPGFSSEGNPYQKPKTQRIWPTIFLKMGGIIPRTLKIGGTCPPVPPVAEPLFLAAQDERT